MQRTVEMMIRSITLMMMVALLIALLFITVDEAPYNPVNPLATSKRKLNSGDLPMTIVEDSEVTMDSICGMKEIKAEISEYIRYFTDRSRYEQVGARLPHGLLFIGPPGCGKTYLAKAMAHDAKATFISVESSNMNEMFVGVGASRVRQIFAIARSMKPCIIFFDEIDSIGAQRGNSSNNQEHASVLNRFLIELDGFESNEDLLVIGSTNRVDALDKALIRSGRFDRRITFDYPSKEERLEMFKIHMAKLKCDDDIDYEELATRTSGLSSADITNISNQSGIICVRKGELKVKQEHVLESIEEMTVGSRRSAVKFTERERRQVSVHEAGHSLLSYVLKSSMVPIMTSIVPHSNGILGYVQPQPNERKLHLQHELNSEIMVLLAGRAGEEIEYGVDSISTGASDDMQKATSLTRDIVQKFGFDSTLGMERFDDDNHSDNTKEIIDKAVRARLQSSYTQVKQILTQHKDKLDALAKHLCSKQTLMLEDVRRIVGPELESTI